MGIMVKQTPDMAELDMEMKEEEEATGNDACAILFSLIPMHAKFSM